MGLDHVEFLPCIDGHIIDQDAFGSVSDKPDEYGYIYSCGECGYSFGRKIKYCKKCGSKLHWVTCEEYCKGM